MPQYLVPTNSDTREHQRGSVSGVESCLEGDIIALENATLHIHGGAVIDAERNRTRINH